MFKHESFLDISPLGLAWTAKVSITFCWSIVNCVRVYFIARILRATDLVARHGAQWAGRLSYYSFAEKDINLTFGYGHF